MQFCSGLLMQITPALTGTLASDHDNEYMMIDATIVRLISIVPEREKKRRASDRPLARRIDNQNPRARRCSWAILST